MDQRVIDFLLKEHVGVLTLADVDSTLYSSALHFAPEKDGTKFYFITERQTDKCKPLLKGEERSAAFVVGFSEQDFKTFQARGTVKLLLHEATIAWNIYLERFPDRAKMHQSPDYVVLEFTPTFWKYLDNKTEPRTRVTSTGTVFPA